MKGWTDIGSDVNWSDYGGKWARRAADGSYYVLDFTNMWDACGEAGCKRDGQDQYVCEVKRVDKYDMPWERIEKALACVGARFLNGAPDGAIVNDQGDVLAEAGDMPRIDLVIAEACVSYGCTQPLESFSANTYPGRVRAEARRYAETCMKDAALLADRLARPVNKIGSTAAEYGRGDIDAALHRGPFDADKNLMRKLYGFPPENGAT
jgi:hypothetical protein